ncbi:DUF4214 domain-containing protein [Halomonas sp. NYA30]
MTSSSRLELIISTSEAERSLRRLEGRLNSADRAGESISKSMTTVERRLAGVERFARSASGAFLGLSAGAGVFTAIARSASQSAAEIDNLSRLANTNVEDFQRLSFASRAYGVEQDKLADILKDTNDRVGDFLSTGGGEMKDFFEQIAPQIGVTAEEFRNLSGPQALQKYYDGLQAANLSQAEMTFYMESVADEATALIPLLRDGGAEMDRLGQEADDLNAILSQMEIQRLKDIRGEFGQLGQQLSTETMRAVSQFDDLMKSSLEGISYGINNVARGFNVFMDSFRDGEAKRSIAGIDAELNALFDTKARLEQRIDMFGADSPQAQDTIAALGELRGEYTALIDRKKELQQAGLPVTEPEIVQLDRASTEIDKQAEAAKGSAKEVTDLADAHESLLDRITPNRREARQYAQDLGVLNLALASGRMTTTQYMQAMGLLQESFQAAQRDTEDLADKTQDAAFSMEESFDELRLNGLRRLDDGFADLWQGAIDGSLNATDIMKRALDQTLAEMAHMAITRPIVVQMQGMMGMGGGEQQAGGGFNLGSMGSAKNAWGAVQNGVGNIAWTGAGSSYSGTDWANAATQGTGATGFLGGSTANFSGMQGLAGAGAGMAGGYVGTELGSSLFGKEANSSIGATGGALAGTYFGGPVGAAIGGAIGGALDSFFGSSGTRPEFTYQQDGRDPATYDFGGRESAFGTFGFEQQRLGEEGRASLDAFSSSLQAADNALAQYMTDGQIRDASAALDAFTYSGLSNADLLADRLDVLLNAAGMQGELYDRMRDELQGADASQRYEAALNIAALESALTSVPENVIAHVDGWMASTDAAVGDAASSLMIQIQQWEQLGGALEQLAPTFDRLANGAVGVTNALHDAAGGMENLQALHSSYYQNFFSEEERQLHLQQQLTDQFAALNMAMPKTRSGFRDLVEAQDIATAAGRDNYLALLELSGGFDQLRQEVGSLDEAVQEVDLSPVRSAYESLQEAISSEQDILRSAHDQTTASIRDNMGRVQDAMRTTERVAGSLQSTLDQMMGNRVIDQRGRFDAASGYLRQTLASGGLDDPDQLERALSVVSQPSEGMYTTLQDYQRDFLSTANIIDQLNDRADEQLTTEDRSLRALERQIDQADRQFDRAMSALDSQLERQTDILEAEFGTQDWLSTVNDSVLSMAQAIAGIQVAAAGGSQGAINVAQGRDREGDPLVSDASGSVADAYRDILGRDPDDSGLDYYSSSGFSAEEIRKRLADSPEAKRYAETGMPGFKNGGIASGPMSGYPVELHGPEAIIPLKGGNVPLNVPGIQALVREVSQLRSELRDSQRSIAEYTRQSARILEREELRQEGEGLW